MVDYIDFCILHLYDELYQVIMYNFQCIFQILFASIFKDFCIYIHKEYESIVFFVVLSLSGFAVRVIPAS